MNKENLDKLKGQVVSKLTAERVHQENYTTEKATKKLSHCVGAKILTQVLIENEIEIKESLQPNRESCGE